MSKRRMKKKVSSQVKPPSESCHEGSTFADDIPSPKMLDKRELLSAIRESKLHSVQLEKEFRRRFRRPSGVEV